MSIETSLALNIFAIVCIVALMAHQYKNYSRTEMGPLVSALFVTICLLLLFDGLYYLFYGRQGDVYRIVLMTVKSLFFVFNSVVVWLWSRIVLCTIWGDEYRKLKQNYVYFAILLINVGLIFFNGFFDIVFRISNEGTFIVSLVGMWILTLLNYLSMLISVVTLILKRNAIKKSELVTMLLFILPPIIAEIVQLVFNNILSLRCLYALSGLLLLQQSQQDSIYEDSLTGLANRRKLNITLTRWLKAKRKVLLCGIMLDIDGLKFTNDTYGHVAGDNALMAVASVLHSVSCRDLLAARYGGDEFVLIWHSRDGSEMDKIVEELEVKKKAHNESVPEREMIEFSVGAFCCPINGTYTAAAFLKKADELMYAQKNAKKV